MQRTKHVGVNVAAIAGLASALPSPAQQQRTMPSARGAYLE